MKLTPSLLLIILIFLIGCTSPKPEQGFWYGAITLSEDQKIQVQLYLDLRQATPDGYFLVGSEKHPIPELSLRGDSLIFTFSEYGAAMKGTISGKRFAGFYYRYRSDTIALPFELAQEPPTPLSSTDTIHHLSLNGKFIAFQLQEDTIDSSSIASFWTHGDSVFGTFLSPGGDYGLHIGKLKGERLRLTRFSGWQASLIELRLVQGKWSGKYYSFKSMPVSFTLEPRANPMFNIDPKLLTRMKSPKARFIFSGITPDGRTVTNDDPRFKQKALIIDIMGTWCHNCGDAAPVLESLNREFRLQGVEVVSLAFERRDDEELGKKNLALFGRRHQTTSTILYCGSLSKENIERRLKTQLENFSSFPTMLFIDRQGKIRYIHTGFNGPGTGIDYQRERDLLYNKTKEIALSK
jgi:thiol-disulfide isomerase/thioredoxin